MKFVYKDKQAEIHFDEREIKILQDKGKLVLEYENIKHLINSLSKIVSDFYVKFEEDHKELTTLQTRLGKDINTE